MFEVAVGADGQAIQQAIGQAAKLSGKRPVVHLPMGKYQVKKTLVIPRDCDVQLIGDGGGETASRLDWAGPADGVLLRLEGPSRATVRDLYIHAPSARGIVVEDADQEGGRIFADQLNTTGPTDQKAGRTAALRVSGLTKTDVLLRALQGNGNGGAWVDVVGAARADEPKNQVSIFTGATGSAAGQYDVRQGGRLVVRGVYHEPQLRRPERAAASWPAGAHPLSIDATRFSYATSDKAAAVSADNFQGLFTLATCMLLPVETKQACRFELSGDGSQASVLALNNQFWLNEPATADVIWSNKAKPPAKGGLIGCNINTSNKRAAPKGFEFLPSVGDHPDPAKSKFGSGPLEDKGGVDEATPSEAPGASAASGTKVWLPRAGGQGAQPMCGCTGSWSAVACGEWWSSGAEGELQERPGEVLLSRMAGKGKSDRALTRRKACCGRKAPGWRRAMKQCESYSNQG